MSAYDIGIEVADSMSQKEQEALHCLYMRDYIDGERTKQKYDNILKNYVADSKCNVFVSSELSCETEKKRKEEFLCSVEKKFKTLNKNQCAENEQGYAEMQHYDLLVLSNWWIEDEHEPILDEIMNGLCKIGDSIDGQKFEIIYLLGAANICEFDMVKKEYHLVMFSSAEQRKFAEEARELAQNGEKTEALQDLSESNKNAEYLAMLDRSQAQLLHGDVVVKTMDELEHMASPIIP